MWVVLVVRLRHECQPAPGCKRVVLHRVESIRHAGEVHDANARIVPAYYFLRCRVP
jgi:hypothetical protein